WVVHKLVDSLNEKGRSLKGSKILLLGVAYKKNVDDTRESPALEIMELLRGRGAEIAYHDPHVPTLPRTRRHHFNLRSIDLRRESISSFDAVIIVTDHDLFDYDTLLRGARLIVDTRNALRRRGIAAAFVPA